MILFSKFTMVCERTTLKVQAGQRHLLETVPSPTEEKPRAILKYLNLKENFLSCLSSSKTLLKVRTTQTQSMKYLDESHEVKVSTGSLIRGSQ